MSVIGLDPDLEFRVQFHFFLVHVDVGCVEYVVHYKGENQNPRGRSGAPKVDAGQYQNSEPRPPLEQASKAHNAPWHKGFKSMHFAGNYRHCIEKQQNCKRDWDELLG